MLECVGCGCIFDQANVVSRLCPLGLAPEDEIELELRCPGCGRYEVPDWFTWKPGHKDAKDGAINEEHEADHTQPRPDTFPAYGVRLPEGSEADHRQSQAGDGGEV